MKLIWIIAAVCAAIAAFYNFYPALGVCVGAAWGSVNLFFIRQLLQSVLIDDPKNLLKILTIAFIKFPLLYGGGYLLLQIDPLSHWSLMIGFSLALAAACLSNLFSWNIPKAKEKAEG